MKRLINIVIGIVIFMLILLPFLALFEGTLEKSYWLEALGDYKVQKAIYTTIGIALATLFINLVIGTPLASALSQKNLPLVKAVEVIVLLPLIIPPLVISTGIVLTFLKIGLADTFLGVVLIHSILTIPYYVRGVKLAYETIGDGYQELSFIMGAGTRERFLYFKLPHLMPGIIASSSLVVIVSFAQYLPTYIIGGGQVITLPLILIPYVQNGDSGTGGIYSIIFIGTNFLLLFLLELGLRTIYSRKKGSKR